LRQEEREQGEKSGVFQERQTQDERAHPEQKVAEVQDMRAA
jgi:hypothetical protein